jgi:hypothetical protein
VFGQVTFRPVRSPRRAGGEGGAGSAGDSDGQAAERGHAPRQQRLLLVVDQFEELFTQCAEEGQRRAFIAALHAAATAGYGADQAGAALVVLGGRADFEARCAEYPQLAGAVQNRYLVTSMTERQLRMAITEPAKKAGAKVDDDLASPAKRRQTEPAQEPVELRAEDVVAVKSLDHVDAQVRGLSGEKAAMPSSSAGGIRLGRFVGYGDRGWRPGRVAPYLTDPARAQGGLRPGWPGVPGLGCVGSFTRVRCGCTPACPGSVPACGRTRRCASGSARSHGRPGGAARRCPRGSRRWCR